MMELFELFMTNQTFASMIPECAECGAKDITIIWGAATGKKLVLRCGHEPNFIAKPNPALFPEAS
jgi:hypothetical protein